MLAARAVRARPDNPLDALEVGEAPDPPPPSGWVCVRVRAAALNHHDLWSLRGVGLARERLPMVLGCDAAGVTDDGEDVVVHAVLGDPLFRGDDETADPRRTLLSEHYPGTLAEQDWVPAANVLPKPVELSFAEAACLPTAWLTAYSMLFRRAAVRPGDTVLVQGSGGGVATAALILGRAAGLRMWVTSRDPARGRRALGLGADAAFASGARLPERVDAVLDSVGAATWSHSINVLRPGGTLVLCGATSGSNPARAELSKIFFRPLNVVGSTMGTRGDLASLLAMLAATGVRPLIDRVLPLGEVRTGLAVLAAGDMFGKIVIVP